MSLRPLVFVGLISYSLYLWHWPLMAYSNYLALSPLTTTYRLGMLILAVLCAILSWKYIETPFRTKTLGTSRKAMFSYTGTGLATILGIGLTCVILQGIPQRYSPETLAYAEAKHDKPSYHNVKLEEVLANQFTQLGVTDTDQAPAVFVWGDSHAQAALPAIDALLKEQGLTGQAAVHSGAAPTLDWCIRRTALLWIKDPIAYSNTVFEYIQAQKIPNVILIARWPGYIMDKSGHITTENSQLDSLDSALLYTVQHLADENRQLIIMQSVPEHSFDVPRVLSRYAWANSYLSSICSKPGEIPELTSNLVSEIEAAGGRVIDPKPRFLDPTGSHYIIQSEGAALYRDDDHLTATGARLMLLPFFREVLTFHPVAPSQDPLQAMDFVAE